MTDFSSVRGRGERVVYWFSTVLVTAELGLGGMWDVLRTEQVRELVDHLGYPSYFLVILGTWKLLGMVALLAPRFPLVKEWPTPVSSSPTPVPSSLTSSSDTGRVNWPS